MVWQSKKNKIRNATSTTSTGKTMRKFGGEWLEQGFVNPIVSNCLDGMQIATAFNWAFCVFACRKLRHRLAM